MSDRPLHTRAWRDFKRMQGAACLFASLIYAAAALNAWAVLPGEAGLKASLILIFPAIFLMAVLWAVLAIGAFRRRLKRYVWMSFAAGFGQTWVSVLTGFGVLLFAALMIYWQVHEVARGGRYPAGVFSGFGAGLGILFGQALLVFALERNPRCAPSSRAEVGLHREGIAGGGGGAADEGAEAGRGSELGRLDRRPAALASSLTREAVSPWPWRWTSRQPWPGRRGI